jgi:amino acid transporter
MFGARAYGEAEFWFASIKILTIIGLIILGIIIAAGGGPTHIATGVQYWKSKWKMIFYF